MGNPQRFSYLLKIAYFLQLTDNWPSTLLFCCFLDFRCFRGSCRKLGSFELDSVEYGPMEISSFEVSSLEVRFMEYGTSHVRGGPRKSDSRIRCKIRQTTRRSHRDEQDKEEEVCSRVQSKGSA
jgi:hypothetical protein